MTPMPNAPNPNAIFGEALARTPAPLPLSTVQEQLAQTAGLNAQVPIQQQTAQELALKNQLTQRTINNLNVMKATLPGLLQKSKGQWDDTIRPGLIAAGMDADEAERVTGAHFLNDEKLAQTRNLQEAAVKAHLENVNQQRVYGARAATGMLQAVKGDGSIDLPMVQAQIENLKAQDPNYNGDGVLEQASKDPEGFKARMHQLRAMAPEVSQQEEEALRTHAQSQLLGGQSEQASAEARKTAAEAGMSELELKLMQRALQNPTAMTDSVDQLIDPKKYPDINARTKTEFSAAMMLGGPKAAQQVLASAVTHINSLEEEISKATNPQILEADAQKAARSEVYKARLAGGPLANVPTEGLQRLAFQGQQKAEQEWHKAEGNAQRLMDSVDLARSQGNQIASGMLPLEVLREVVPRVARQEIPMASGGQSIARRLGNWLSRGATGVPEDITLQDMENFSKAILESAKTVYRGDVGGINRSTKATYDTEPPITPRSAEAPAPATGGPPLITTKAAFDALPRGTVYKERDGNTYTKP